jgi:hypothetical protein
MVNIVLLVYGRTQALCRCVGQITLNEVVCHWKQKNEKDEHTGRDKGRVRDCGEPLRLEHSICEILT